MRKDEQVQQKQVIVTHDDEPSRPFWCSADSRIVPVGDMGLFVVEFARRK